MQTDEPEPKQDGTVIVGALMLAILGVGAFWYLKQLQGEGKQAPARPTTNTRMMRIDETKDDDLNE